MIGAMLLSLEGFPNLTFPTLLYQPINSTPRARHWLTFCVRPHDHTRTLSDINDNDYYLNTCPFPLSVLP